jgi:hypothetical protein
VKKVKGKKLKLVIAVPSRDEWLAKFGMSLLFMVQQLNNQIPGFAEQQAVVLNKRGSILAQMRQKIIEQALAMQATHVLFVDSDQTFPADLVHRLLQHNVPVVACNVATKTIPSSPTARAKGDTPAGVPVPTLETSTGLQKVWRIGTGVMLIDLRIFKRPGMEAPWFSQRWDETIGEYVGEDWAFCEKLESAGVHIYIDHDVSKEIGHVGTMEYDHSLVVVEE